MRTSRRLAASHLVSYFLARSGVWSLIWKDWIQVSRRLDIRSAISWLALIGAGAGMMVAPDLGTRIWVFIVWGLLIGQVCTHRFHSDLNLWVIFRQLPFSGKEILLVEIVSPVIAATILCWLTFGIFSLMGLHPSLPVVVLSPGIILNITLASVFDILRQSKADALMTGHVVEMGAVGLIIGLILAGLPLALVLWISNIMSINAILWLISFVGLFIGLGIAYGMWQLAVSQYKKL